ncbi:MAG: hypothetical protein AAFV43_12620 [Planctomycetota bacterium]
MRNTLAVLALAPLTTLLAPTAARAAVGSEFTLIDAEGFEPPAYNEFFLGTGQLEGQFASTFEGLGATPWQQIGPPVGGTATIQSGVVASGAQALRVDRAPGIDDQWSVALTPFSVPLEPLVIIDWNMLVEPFIGPQPFGPFFGVEAYGDSGAGSLRLASLGLDATTGDVLYRDTAFGVFETGFTAPVGVWNSYRVALDYSAGASLLFVNGEQVRIGPFEAFGVSDFTEAAITAAAAGSDPGSSNATGTAYFDNYRVYETNDFTLLNPVDPEPQAGDFSGDGVVDNTDLNLLLVNWGNPASPLPPGWDGDPPVGALIDNDELNALLPNWGVGVASVPEPAAGVLLLLASAACRRRR